MLGNRRDSPPKWINPCGDNTDFVDEDVDDLPHRPNAMMAQQISLSAKIALDHARRFRDSYVRHMFHVELNAHHSAWENARYDWLPSSDEVPKKFGEPVPQDHKESIAFEDALVNAYEALQKCAVGLEQVAVDMEAEKGQFEKNFQETEIRLQTVLCELYNAIYDVGATQKPDVLRDAMPEHFRDIKDATQRQLRDWIIFRDYMNVLEYVIEVFDHFKKISS